ncbi:hypothetical protein [Actinokineospora sp.]|uniref:hypothetical protein n=1 Tax=Actinokineospora sp. TaxID=1872133 RepID=UPI004038132C
MPYMIPDRSASELGRQRVPQSVTLAAMTTMKVQVDLRSDNRYLTCWVEPRVKVGDRITLKNSAEPLRRWDVLRVGAPSQASDINRGWNNNY